MPGAAPRSRTRKTRCRAARRTRSRVREASVPEGDTIFRAARTLHRALAGKRVVRFESVFPALTRVHDDSPLTDRLVESVSSAGKHLLMRFSGDLVLRTHMRMNGSWHIYRPGEAWQRPRRDMRIVVATDDFVAVGFNMPVAEFIAARTLARHDELRRLGPDLLGDRAGRGRRAGPHARASARRDRGRAAQPAGAGRHRQRLQVGGAVRLRREPVRDGAGSGRRDTVEADRHGAAGSCRRTSTRRWRR